MLLPESPFVFSRSVKRPLRVWITRDGHFSMRPCSGFRLRSVKPAYRTCWGLCIGIPSCRGHRVLIDKCDKPTQVGSVLCDFHANLVKRWADSSLAGNGRYFCALDDFRA